MTAQSADNALVGPGFVRRILQSLAREEVSVVSLAPPTLAMLDPAQQDEPVDASRFMMAPPAWYLDFLPIVSHGGMQAWAQRHDVRPYFAPIDWAASRDSERLRASGPLTMLANGQGQPVLAHRLRRIDRIAGGLARCSLLILGSGEVGLPILDGAMGLVASHRPIIVFDLAELLSDRPSSNVDLISAVMARLSGYQMAHCAAAYADGMRNEGRFLIAHASQAQAAFLSGLTAIPDTMECVEWSADLLCPVGSVSADDESRFVATGQGTAIEFAIECPEAITGLAFELEGHAPFGLRILVDGTDHGVVHDPKAASPSVTDVMPMRVSTRLLNAPQSGPRLLHIRLCPIRMSTTGGNAPLRLTRVIAFRS